MKAVVTPTLSTYPGFALVQFGLLKCVHFVFTVLCGERNSLMCSLFYNENTMCLCNYTKYLMLC